MSWTMNSVIDVLNQIILFPGTLRMLEISSQPTWLELKRLSEGKHRIRTQTMGPQLWRQALASQN